MPLLYCINLSIQLVCVWSTVRIIMVLWRFVFANLLLFSVKCTSSCPSRKGIKSESDSCPPIVSRADWQAKTPKERQQITSPVPYVILHHTGSWRHECFDSETCAGVMRSIQGFHQYELLWADIGYNFCVGEDGRIYEGRGWDTVGAHAPSYNFHSIGICMMGDFENKVPNKESINAVAALISCSVGKMKLMSNYTLYGHRQVRDTDCPGNALFGEIQSWPHWQSGNHFSPGKTDWQDWT